MAKENLEILPVISDKTNDIIGVISYREIIATYKSGMDEHLKKNSNVSLKRQGLKIVLRGKKMRSFIMRRKE